MNNTTMSPETELSAELTVNRTTTSHPRRLRGVIAAAVGTVVTGLAMLVGGTAEAAAWQLYYTDADRCADIAGRDSNYNGWHDEYWFDLDNDCGWDTHLYNSTGNEGLLEVVTFDMDENNRVDAWMLDTNQLEGFEWAYFDTNRDGYFETVRQVAPQPVPVDLWTLRPNPGLIGQPDLDAMFAFGAPGV